MAEAGEPGSQDVARRAGATELSVVFKLVSTSEEGGGAACCCEWVLLPVVFTCRLQGEQPNYRLGRRSGDGLRRGGVLAGAATDRGVV